MLGTPAFTPAASFGSPVFSFDLKYMRRKEEKKTCSRLI